MSRPQFALATVRVEYEFEGNRYAGTRFETIGMRYYQSEAGVMFANRQFDPDHEEMYVEMRKLMPGKVYNHVKNCWEDGLTYQKWWPHRDVEVVANAVDYEDDIPF